MMYNIIIMLEFKKKIHDRKSCRVSLRGNLDVTSIYAFDIVLAELPRGIVFEMEEVMVQSEVELGCLISIIQLMELNKCDFYILVNPSVRLTLEYFGLTNILRVKPTLPSDMTQGVSQ